MNLLCSDVKLYLASVSCWYQLSLVSCFSQITKFWVKLILNSTRRIVSQRFPMFFQSQELLLESYFVIIIGKDILFNLLCCFVSAIDPCLHISSFDAILSYSKISTEAHVQLKYLKCSWLYLFYVILRFCR